MNTDNKCILMGKKNKVYAVYTDEMRASLSLGAVVTKQELIDSRGLFEKTEFIFSTWGMPAFTAEEISALLPSLRAVFYAAGSVQSFAREFLTSGVAVFSAWQANAVPVAEFTEAQIVLANKGYFRAVRLLRQERNNRVAAAISASHKGNYGATVGIIGCGVIGSMVAERLKRYNFTVLAFDPFMSEEKAAALGVIKTELDEIFNRCDVVTNHVANNARTVGMIKGCHFASMKENAVFINTGRGAQIVEDEMLSVLKQRDDITALLDVTYPEPPVPDSPLYTLPNVFLSPHIAGSLSDERVRMAEYMRDEYHRFINGKPTPYNVTLKMLETMA